MTPEEALGLWEDAGPLPEGVEPPCGLPAASVDLGPAGGVLELHPHPRGAGRILARWFPGGRIEYRER